MNGSHNALLSQIETVNRPGDNCARPPRERVQLVAQCCFKISQVRSEFETIKLAASPLWHWVCAMRAPSDRVEEPEGEELVHPAIVHCGELTKRASWSFQSPFRAPPRRCAAPTSR